MAVDEIRLLAAASSGNGLIFCDDLRGRRMLSVVEIEYVDDFVQARVADADPLRELQLRNTKRFEKFFKQYFARGGWASVRRDKEWNRRA